MPQRESDNEERGEVRGKDAFGVMLAVVVAALIIPSGLYLVGAILNDGCVWGSTAGCERAGTEVLVIPIGVIAGALLWRRLELAIRLEASRIGPWLPILGPGVLLGALLVLFFWTWGDWYRWYGPAPLSGAALLAVASFVFGRFHPRASAVLAISIAVPAIPTASTLAVCAYPYASLCAAEGPLWGGCTGYSDMGGSTGWSGCTPARVSTDAEVDVARPCLGRHGRFLCHNRRRGTLGGQLT